MGAWDKFLRITKGKAGGNTVDLEEAEKLNDKEYVKQLEDIYNKAAGVYMDPALKGMEELDKDAQNEQKIIIAGAKRFKEGIIRDLENNLLKAENLGIDNLDNYRQLLYDLRNFQIPNEMPKEIESMLNRARKIVNRFGTELEIDGFRNEAPNDETMKQTVTNTNIVKENGQKETQNDNKVKPNEISRTGSLENQGTQWEGTLKKKDKIKTDLEEEDKDIDQKLRQKWDRMLGL